MKTINKKKFAIGTAMFAGMISGCATAEKVEFEQKELSSGYMNEADSTTKKMKDGTCGEGKCGSSKVNTTEKTMEGKCGEGKCGTTSK